jgi:hypothetical protein
VVIVLDRNYHVIREEGEIDLELVAEKMFDVFFLLFIVAFAAGLAVWAVFKELAKFGGMWL